MPTSDVYLEDCVKALKRYADNHFDLAIVDPPYGIGIDGQKQSINLNNPKANRKAHSFKGWDNEIPKAEYFAELERVSKNQIIWGGNYFIEHLKNTRCFIVWNKENGTNNMADCELAWASFETSVRMYSGHIFKGIGNSNYATIHPTQKPIVLYKWLLDKYAKPNDKILDTHLGSGSIAIACHDYGFNLTACELDKEYFDKAVQRINNHISQQKLF